MPSRVHYTYTDQGLLDKVLVEIGCCETHPSGVNFLEILCETTKSGGPVPLRIMSDWASQGDESDKEEDVVWEATLKATMDTLMVVCTAMPDMLLARSESSVRALAEIVERLWEALDNQA